MELEKAFQRAIVYSLSWKRLLITFPVLLLCGILILFCQVLSLHATSWIQLCLGFLPIFIISGLLLALGVILTKIYAFEIKNMALNVRRLLASSMDLIIGISYLALPSLLVFIVCWIILGVFYLLKVIPGIGAFFSVVFAFGPFLLIFVSMLLVVFNLALLFFIAPSATILTVRKGSIAKKMAELLKTQILRAAKLFLLGMVPTAILFAMLYFSAHLTNTSFFVSENGLMVAMEWFFMMIPFAALMSPAVVFFFNFAAESYLLLQKKD
ncbi:MAG TPA: hypothetical protein VLE96_01915 [Chlamydiales bacterium]|nr:hypothetical protein [Chlamydiales bacterium]